MGNPQVSIQGLRHFLDIGRSIQALRPDRTTGPNSYLADFTYFTCPCPGTYLTNTRTITGKENYHTWQSADKRGIKFGYHNHNFEFATIPNTDQMYEDFLIANTDPDKVFSQMDVYWITVGGQDPVAYLKKYPNRFKVLHIKDDYVIGESGTIDYKAIFKQFYKNGNKDWFVEMEAKMTKEQKEQMMAMMEQMKQRQGQSGSSQGGNIPGGQGNQRPGPQGGAAPQSRQSGAPAGIPGSGQQAPQTQAEQLKTSLEGIRQSALYLIKSNFVK
jgi:hypothetical protein